MSWKPEVQTDDSGKWYGNALRFATKEEADAQVRNLSLRWTAVRDCRATECSDPVTHEYIDGRSVEVPVEAPSQDRSTYGEDTRRGELSDDLGESPDY